MQVTVRDTRKYSITLVIRSCSDSIHIGTRIEFSTAACGQVRFDVGVRNFRLEVFLMDSRMAPCRGVQQHDGMFILYP
jgi:hypothetical protein